MNLRSRRISLLVLASFSLAVAGCGSSGSSGSGGSDSDDPIQLAFLWEVKGESSYAIQDFQNGADLAIKNLNDDGGIDGREVEFTRYPASPTDASQTITQYLKAVQEQPDMTLGPPGPIQEALTPNLDRSKIPNFSISPDLKSEFGAEFGSEYRFSPAASPEDLARSAATYAVEELGATNIGMISSPDASDTALADAAREAIGDLGAEISVERSVAVDATDVTKEILAMRGTEAILIFSYEGPTGLAANQLAQAGINVPLIGYTSVYPLISEGLVNDDALANIRGVTPCGLYGDDAEPSAKAFVDQYQAAYDMVPSTQAATAYDAVMIAAQAVADAGDGGSEAILEALNNEEFPDGACGPHKANEQHWMGEKLYVHSFPGGEASLEADYTVGQ